MPIDFEFHKSRLNLKNLFDIIPVDIMKELIKGFFYNLKQGVALRLTEIDENSGKWIVKDDVINPFNPLNPEDSRFLNPVCRLYRNNTREGDARCNQSDKETAECYLWGKF